MPCSSCQGHGKAVKDISFNHDGTNFVSAGYDRNIKLWDTETGECVRRFCNHKLPYSIQFHPGGVSYTCCQEFLYELLMLSYA